MINKVFNHLKVALIALFFGLTAYGGIYGLIYIFGLIEHYVNS